MTKILNNYNEVEEHFDKFKEIEDVVKGVIDSKKPMDMKGLSSLLNKIVGKAKAEFNAYVENCIHEIDIETIKKK